MVVLKTKNRKKKDSLKKIRKEGFIPAVYYGRTQEAVSVSVPVKDFEKIWRDEGESAVVTLEDEKKGKLDALIHDVDIDPIYNRPRHADFYVFEEGKTIEVSVPVEFVGEAPLVKSQKAILVKVLREITVDAMPRSIPSQVDVDVSSLETLDDQILAKDIKLPEEVILKDDPEEVVAALSEAQEEVEEPEETEDVDFSSIEVEKKGKEEEEGGETEENTSSES